jgi:aspartyl-tRNA(Asn)/glutamyl-tRNA(Gln) amidotransferase subunit C
MMAITKKDVEEIALLSRLEMSDEELEMMTTQLSQILEYASMLNELDIRDVEPTMHAVPLTNVLRDDVAKESLPLEKVLANAPESFGGFFRVPRIIDEGEAH